MANSIEEGASIHVEVAEEALCDFIDTFLP